MLTRNQRITMAVLTSEAMQEVYEAEGEEGDFDDARRYLRDDASDHELEYEYKKWVKKPLPIS